MHIKLANGLTMSVQNDARLHYSGAASSEIAFWRTDGTGPEWVVPPEFAAYSQDGQICAWVPRGEIEAYVGQVGVTGL